MGDARLRPVHRAALRAVEPHGGLVYSGAFTQLGYQVLGNVVTFATVLTLTEITWWAIKRTIGVRVSADEELAGGTSPSTGCTATREQFISDAELHGPAVPASIKLNGHAPAPAGSAEAAPA